MDAGGHFISKIFTPKLNKGVGFDNKSYVIDNKRTFLISGSIHYPRIPREEWEERILLAKSNGLNTIQSYVFWNVHEPLEGDFYFDDYADLDYFISLIKKHDLYMVLRLGPYVNAERDNGGFPKWLSKYDCKVRVDDKKYLEFVLKFYDKIFDVVEKYKYTNGGPIIIVQYENEVLWDESIPYLEILHDYVKERFNDIILIESGMYHEGGLSLGDGQEQIYHNTEMWMGWLYRWGEKVLPGQAGVNTYSKIYQGLARGVDGFNYYMFSGGTNFDYSQSSGYPTCYELGEAPLNEQGTPTRLYFVSRAINKFIKSFESEITSAIPYCNDVGTQQSEELIQNWGMIYSSINSTKFYFGYGDGSVDEILGYKLDYNYSVEKPICFVFDFETQGCKIDFAGPNILYRDDKILFLYADVGDDIKIRYNKRNINVFVDQEDFCEKMNIDGKLQIFVSSRKIAEQTVVENGVVYANAGFNIKEKIYNFLDTKKEIKIGNNLKKVKIDNSVSFGNNDFNLRLVDSYFAHPEIFLEDGSPLWIENDEPMAIDDFNDSNHDYAWYRFVIDSDTYHSNVLFFEDIQDQIFIYFNGAFHQSSQYTIWDGRSFENKMNISLSIKKGRNVLDILLKSWGRYKGFNIGNETLKDAGQTKYFRMSYKNNSFNFIGPVKHLRGISLEYRKDLLDKKSKLGEIGNVFEYRFDYDFESEYTIKPRLNIGKSTLTQGVLFLNGRNIGLYCNRGYEKLRGYNLPYKWLKKHDNILEIYEDLDGRPDGVFFDINHNASYKKIDLL